MVWRARLAAGIAVLCVLLLTVWQVTSSYREAVADARTQVTVLSRIAEEHVAGMMRGVDLVLSEMAGLADDDGRIDGGAFSALLGERMRRLDYIRSGFMVDARGVVNLSTIPGLPSIDVGDREYFTTLAANPGQTLYISAPLHSRAQPEVSVIVARSLRALDGRFLGVAAIAIDPRLFEDELNTVRPPQGGNATLLRTEGTVLMRVPDGEKWLGKWLGDGPVVRALATAPQGVLHGAGRTDGGDRIVSYRQLQFYPLVVVVGMRTAAVLDKWRTDALLHGAVGGVLALVLAGLALMSDRRQAERRRAELALAASEERFRLLSERSPVGIVLAGADGDCRYVNRRWLEIIGRDADAVGGSYWFEAVALDDRPAVAAAWTEFVGGGEFLAEMRIRTSAGTTRWVRGRASRLGGVGSEAELVATFEDITDARQAQQGLVLSEEKFAKAFRGSPDALVISTLEEGTYVDVNAAFCRMLGYDRAELIGNNSVNLDVWVDFADRARVVERVRRDGQVENHETRLRRKGGVVFTVLMSVQRIEVGGESCLLFICRDVSEQRLMEARTQALVSKLDASNKELEQFAYVASHDLQEPLRMIAGYAQLIERRYRGRLDSDADEFIGFLVDGAKRMQGMIQDLLDYSRVERMGGAFAEFDGAEMLDDVRHNLAGALAETGGIIRTGTMPRLHGDRSQITRLLQNLIGNALKYRHPDRVPDITVAAEPEMGEGGRTGGWIVSVSDNGIGIDPAYFDRIFLVFQRLHTRDRYPGTGIGLAICKKIVERHGGRLWVESEPERGSVFRFSLPPGRPAALR